MAQKEANAGHTGKENMAQLGVTLLKNARVKFRTLDGQWLILAGLSTAGSSDLIGLMPVIINLDRSDRKSRFLWPWKARQILVAPVISRTDLLIS